MKLVICKMGMDDVEKIKNRALLLGDSKTNPMQTNIENKTSRPRGKRSPL